VSPEKAEQIAKAVGVPPALLVRLSIEDSLQAAGLKYRVEIKPEYARPPKGAGARLLAHADRFVKQRGPNAPWRQFTKDELHERDDDA
jgi:hypothetical protein